METDLLLKGCRFSVQRFKPSFRRVGQREHSGIIALSSSIRPVGQLKQKYRVTLHHGGDAEFLKILIKLKRNEPCQGLLSVDASRWHYTWKIYFASIYTLIIPPFTFSLNRGGKLLSLEDYTIVWISTLIKTGIEACLVSLIFTFRIIGGVWRYLDQNYVISILSGMIDNTWNGDIGENCSVFFDIEYEWNIKNNLRLLPVLNNWN